MSNEQTKKIYLQQGNVSFHSNVKIGQIQLTNEQFKQLLLDNISWKRYVSYPIGQVCSRKTENFTAFYYSVAENNIGHDPLESFDTLYWKPIVSANQQSSLDLIFKIPNIQSDDSLKIQIQFSENNDFSNSYILDSSNIFQPAVFYISDPNNSEIVAFNGGNIQSVLSNQILILKKQTISQHYKYFRYKWLSTKNGQSKYYFGVVNSQIQTFDSNFNEYSQVHVDNKNIIGNGTEQNPLKLNNGITINKIIGDDNFKIQTNDSNITITAANGSGQLNLNITNLKLNNNSLNYPNGLLVLNSDGKIDQSFYVDGDFNNRLLPLKNNISQQFYGNPLVIHKVGDVQYNIQNNSSTVLLLQGSNKNNLAVGKSSDIIYDSYITQQKQQKFKGGYILKFDNTLQSKLLNNILQISIQVENKGLSEVYYKSVFQHFIQNGQLCYFGVNKVGFVFGSQAKLSNTVLFNDFNIGNNQYYKFVIQYNYNVQSDSFYCDIYCNGQLCVTYNFDCQPFLNSEDNIYFYFCEQITNRSTDIHLNGLNTYWRLLKVDVVIKQNEINKPIGQLYYDQTNLNYSNIKVDYNWSSSNDIQDAFVFGKKNGQPYIFPYPKTLYQLPTASQTTKGGVIIGNGIYVDQSGVISIDVDLQSLNLGTYVQNSSELNIDGNIDIKSNISPNSSVTIQSGDIQNNNIGGKLFLGSNKEGQKYSLIYWVDDKAAVTVGQLQSKIKYNNTQIILKQSQININADRLRFNNKQLNSKGGLVQLNDNGKIDNSLLNIIDNNGNLLFENKIVVYDAPTQNQYQCNKIQAGVGVSINVENGIAVINANEQGKLRQDIKFSFGNLTFNEQNQRYTYIVQNINLGGFVVQDNDGYLIYPLQRQISINGNNCVEIDFTQFVGEHGLISGQIGIQNNEYNEDVVMYRIRFVRGHRGNNGQITKDEALNMILTYLM